MDEKTSTGSIEFDLFLEGGFETDVVTTLYGPSGSGKSNLGILFASTVAKNNEVVIYIDTEGGFSLSRLQQIDNAYANYLENIIILKTTTFEQQKEVFNKLSKYITPATGAIIIDSIAMLYRLELGKSDEIYEVNRELGKQIGILNDISRNKKIPVLIMNQVYSNFDERDQVKMVGGDLLKYSSKCLIEFQNYKSVKRAILKKHRSIPENKEFIFKITNEGIHKVEENTNEKENKKENYISM